MLSSHHQLWPSADRSTPSHPFTYSIMPLHLLPWIFLSPYLKTESLARLFATLDKSLISALSQHNAIDTLATFEGASEAWPAVMLFRSVQSVRCLEIAFVPSRGDPQNFSGLARLNPQELFFFDGDKRPNGSTPFFKRLALDRPNEHLTKGKHPRLATLFPALNSLRMGTAVSEDSYLLYNHQELNANFLPPLEFIAAMPSTLTVLHLDRVWHFGTSYEIYALPTSITDLHCDYIEKQDQRELFNISAALKHLQNLTRLTLIRVAYLGLEKDYKQLIREAYDGLMDDYEEEDYSDRLRKDESIPVTFPASLTDLTLKDYVESFPIELLTSPALASSSLTRLTVHGTISLTNPFALEENLQWADIMPSSLTHLDLIGTFDHRSASVRIKSLPTSLTELHFDFFELLDLAAPLLTPLRSLETLTFRTAVEAIAHWDLDWNKCDERTRRLNLTALPTMPLELLPASLKRLTLKRDAPQSLTLAELQRLPSNLDFLCLPRFDLSQLETLRKHLPKAFLEITQEIILTEPGNGALLRKLLAPSDVAPVLSLARVERAIRLWCNTNRVGFPLSLLPLVPYGHHPVKVSSNFAQTQKLVLDQKVMKAWPSDEGPNVFVRTMGVRLFNYNFFGTTSAMENAFPNAKTLEAHILRSRPVGGAALPPTLTTLDLHNTNFSIQLKELPFTLTRLTSNMPLEIARRQVIPFDSMSPRLKVLRTPKWEIDYFALLRIISPDMEVFEVTISGVADYNVIPLLERAISPHDLLVGRLCLKYACTGILVEDMDFEDGKADFAAIKAETTKTLMERLNSAIVPLPASLSLARDPDVWKKASGGWIPLRLALGPDFKFINERIGVRQSWLIPRKTRSSFPIITSSSRTLRSTAWTIWAWRSSLTLRIASASRRSSRILRSPTRKSLALSPTSGVLNT